MALSVLSLNCNGIRDASKRAGLLHWVRSLPVRPDIICLQEVHCSSVQECSSWFQSSGFGVACSPGSVRSSGCAILSRDSLSVSDSWCDAEGCYLQCEFSFQDQSFRVCCLYVPNRNPARDSFLHDLQVKIDFSVPSLFCGDFNTVLVAPIRRTRLEKVLLPFVASSMRVLWWIFSVVPCPFSDHCGVQVSVTVPDIIPSAPGLWKLNTAVLKDAEYVRLISEFWQAWCGVVVSVSGNALSIVL